MLPTNLKLIIDLAIGDGWIGYHDNNRKNAYFICCHGEKQIDYCKYKESLLNNFGYITRGVDKVNDNITSKNYGKRYYTVYTREHQDFSAAHKHIYNKNHKTIDKHLLRDLDQESLAYWFMDDGSAKTVQYLQQDNKDRIYYNQKKANAYKLSTNCFSYDEHILIKDWLLEKFGINCTIQKDGKSFTISINTIKDKDTFRSIILPYVEKVPCLLYKLSYPHSFKDIPFTIKSFDEYHVKRLNETTPTDDESEGDATVQD